MKHAVYRTTPDGRLTPLYSIRVGYVFYESANGRRMTPLDLSKSNPGSRMLQVISAMPGEEGEVLLLVHKLTSDARWQERGKIRTTQTGLLRVLRDGFTMKE